MAWYSYENYKDTLPVSIRPFLAELGKVIFLGLYQTSPNGIAVSSLHEQLAIPKAEFSPTPLRKSGVRMRDIK
jgi:hypothetical protein